ncbi:MAG: DUF4278 domain-containing protein [Prochlorothrix sp.]|nr:DUF4278 domain-containing protein [Prochlorothrix sp.]
MQLRYRGVSYNHDPIQVKTVPGGRVVRFLGSSVVARQVDFSQPAFTQEGGQYRGVNTVSGQKLRFLGKVYDRCSTVFVPMTSA